ncbi:uracil-DNA glycosylase [Streptococcaceae bacterium ESL0729]|nr:uracil-DNA glycosylase [Streptococcaceae bacterium ESL0729]
MEYPQEMFDEVKRASESFKLEGFLPGQGNDQARLMLVGEAPGKTEIENKIAFSGAAGKWFDSWFEHAGFKRADLYIASAVRKRPYKVKVKARGVDEEPQFSYPNRTPSPKEVFAQAPLLDYEINEIKPLIIAPMGNTALHRLLGNELKVSDCHGQIRKSPILEVNALGDGYQWSNRSYLIYPLYHPASVIYNRKLELVIEEDWLRLKDILNKLENSSKEKTSE